MSKKLLMPWLLWALSMTAHAQVTAEIQFDQEQFLRSESLPLRLRISNLAGQTLRLGEPGWLSFVVENSEGKVLGRANDITKSNAFELDSAKAATLRVDLMPYFQLGEVGHYTVTATIRLPQLKQEVTTKPKAFDIVSGVNRWEREFGLPGRQTPEVRKYALQQATFLNQSRLYLRLTDPSEAKVFRVTPLGPLVSFSYPEAQIDRMSNLHVLFQTHARTFLYSVISPDGELFIRQTHEYSNTRPVLRADEAGRILVNGGQRRPTLSDLPPAATRSTTNEVSQSR